MSGALVVLAAAVAASSLLAVRLIRGNTEVRGEPPPDMVPEVASANAATVGQGPVGRIVRPRIRPYPFLLLRPRMPASAEGQGETSATPAGGVEAKGVETTAATNDGEESSREPPIFDLLRHHREHPVSPKVAALAQEITKDSTNSVTKARAIYDWLVANIRYDTREWENIAAGASEYIHDHDPDTVLERGTTVCIGYAWLFDDLCEAAGLESTYLIGDVRGYRGTPDDELVSSIRHAWSAVRDENGWKLLDATWGARQEGEGESDYKWRADYYYGTPPSQFIYDHLPEDTSWQLLDEPVATKSAFSSLPNLKPSFFTDGLTLPESYTSVLRASSGDAHRLTIGKPAGTDVAFTLSTAAPDAEAKRIGAIVTDGGAAASAIIPPLTRGDYLLRVYSRSGKGAYACGADFAIRVE